MKKLIVLTVAVATVLPLLWTSSVVASGVTKVAAKHAVKASTPPTVRAGTLNLDPSAEPAIEIEPNRVTVPATARALRTQSGQPDPPQLDNVLFFDDFEGEFPGPWTITGNPSTWGLETERSHSGNGAVWCNGNNREPAQGYRSNCSSTIWMRVDLTRFESGTLSFWHWCDTQAGYDNLFVGVSNSGYPFTGLFISGNIQEWRRETLDISDFCGDEMMLIFRFQTSPYYEYEGVWIDDVTITGIEAGTPDLKVTSITHSPENPQPWFPVTVSVTVLNYGDSNSGPFYVDLFLDQPSKPMIGDYGGLYQFVPNGLNAGTTQEFQFMLDYPVHGTKHLWSIVDTDQMVDEFNELDNVHGPYDLPVGVATVATVTPGSPVIIVPPTGGSFNYNVSVDQYTDTAWHETWTTITYLGTGTSLQVEFLDNQPFVPGDPLQYSRTQNVPGFAPPGNYQVTVTIGTYPWTIHDTGSFQFTKAGGVSNPSVASLGTSDDWPSTGSTFAAGDGDASVQATLPEQFGLSAAYPNPFNPSTSFEVMLPSATQLEVTVYTMQGREVDRLASGDYTAGSHRLCFDGHGLASGVYLISALTSAGESAVQKVVLMK
ncbi:T9SS type A sorting domain-containing protein [bacterium]|nr:T9SS type A sorting domain-containing protein [bacterium]